MGSNPTIKPSNSNYLKKNDINLRELTPMERNFIIEKKIRITKPVNNWMFKSKVNKMI
jgi:hypothetical protein